MCLKVSCVTGLLLVAIFYIVNIVNGRVVCCCVASNVSHFLIISIHRLAARNRIGQIITVLFVTGCGCDRATGLSGRRSFVFDHLHRFCIISRSRKLFKQFWLLAIVIAEHVSDIRYCPRPSFALLHCCGICSNARQ